MGNVITAAAGHPPSLPRTTQQLTLTSYNKAATAEDKAAAIVDNVTNNDAGAAGKATGTAATVGGTTTATVDNSAQN